MNYKLIGDSCSDLDEEQIKENKIIIVPLMLQIGDYHVVDDDKFNQIDFIHRMAASSIGPKTACPSAEAFKEAYEKCDKTDGVFVVTLSEHLSGTYQSAGIGKQMYEEEHGKNDNIFILNSNSASAGQFRLLKEIERLIAQGLNFEEIKNKITALRDRLKTYFVLESLENLRKNGRISGLSAFFATALNIKPVMGAVGGVIVKLDQARGINKALKRMVELAVKDAGELAKEMTVCITNVNDKERANFVANAFKATGKFKEILFSNAAGVATVYAGEGGIVIGIG